MQIVYVQLGAGVDGPVAGGSGFDCTRSLTFFCASSADFMVTVCQISRGVSDYTKTYLHESVYVSLDAIHGRSLGLALLEKSFLRLDELFPFLIKSGRP